VRVWTGLNYRRIGSSGQAVVFAVMNIKYINQQMQTVSYNKIRIMLNITATFNN